MKSKCLVLLSGGQDSATCLAIAKNKYKKIWTMSFYYGQRHHRELAASLALSNLLEAEEHFVVNVLAINHVAISNLTRKEGDISSAHPVDSSLPSSFVPGRNLVFLTLASAKAYGLGIKNVITGVCQTDYSGYPDCRNDFIKSAEKTITLGLGTSIHIVTPLMNISKAETVRIMQSMNAIELYRYTHTCYEGLWPPCDRCPACKLRAKGFEIARIEDPLLKNTQLGKDPIELYNSGNIKYVPKIRKP